MGLLDKMKGFLAPDPQSEAAPLPRYPSRPSPRAETPRSGIRVPADPELARVITLLNQHAAVVKTTNTQIRDARRQIAVAGGAPTFTEYTQDLMAGRPSRTDAPWEWLLRAAQHAAEVGELEAVAAIGQFVDFVGWNGATYESQIDLADVRLWPMSPHLLVPFADVVLLAVHELPHDWRLIDGSGDSIDQPGLLLTWALNAEDLEGVEPVAAEIAALTRAVRGVTAGNIPGYESLTRRANRDAQARRTAEELMRARNFAGCLDYARGMEAPARDDDAGALQPLTAAARSGHVQADLQGAPVAMRVGRDSLALELWDHAARAGNPQAMRHYALCLLGGNREAEALTWFERAGAKGDVKSYAMLAVLHRDDPIARRKWLS